MWSLIWRMPHPLLFCFGRGSVLLRVKPAIKPLYRCAARGRTSSGDRSQVASLHLLFGAVYSLGGRGSMGSCSGYRCLLPLLGLLAHASPGWAQSELSVLSIQLLMCSFRVCRCWIIMRSRFLPIDITLYNTAANERALYRWIPHI